MLVPRRSQSCELCVGICSAGRGKLSLRHKFQKREEYFSLKVKEGLKANPKICLSQGVAGVEALWIPLASLTLRSALPETPEASLPQLLSSKAREL